jgi:hypothetical protein
LIRTVIEIEIIIWALLWADLYNIQCIFSSSEAESKEKHGVGDPMQELTLTSPYDPYTFTMGLGNKLQ